MILVLSLEESEDQIISGFPEYVVLTANHPATIFYTLDGSDPDEFSEIFIGKLALPLDGVTLTLKAIAVAAPVTSSILEKTYFTNQKKLDKTRIVGKEGIRVLPANAVPVDNLSYNSDGDPAQQTAIPFNKLDMIGSTSDYRGQDISGDTTLDFVNFGKKQVKLESPARSSPNDNNINFDPKAFYIIIDGTTEDKIDNQIVRIINRPHGTMDLLSPIYARSMQNYQLNTSNFVRYMIDPKTGKIVFYYRDSRENRWISSIQKTEPKGLNLTATAGPPNSFVFRWIEFRAQSKIY